MPFISPPSAAAYAWLLCKQDLITAYYWFKSSRIDVDPNTGLLPDFHFVPDRDYSSTINALRRVGELNKNAAMWSAVSATLFAVAGLI
jgi:hypothetical protein